MVVALNSEVRSFIRSLKIGNRVNIVYNEVLAIAVERIT
jgi:hypothetical protein